MKEEVPPPLVDAHLRTVQEAVKEGVTVDPSYALDKTGIAGTAAEKADRETGLSPGFIYKHTFKLLLLTTQLTISTHPSTLVKA